MTLAMTLRKATGLAIATVAAAALLSAQPPVKYQATWESLNLKIQLPQAKPCDYAYAFRISFK